MAQATSSDGTKISFVKSGSGRPLLLVHGTTADHTRWNGILPRLEQHFTVYAMDRRGRGGSGDAPDYEFQREAEDVATVLGAIGEPTAVLGHSFGALCSLEAALLTNKISQLVLYEPPLPPLGPPVPSDVPDRMNALIDNGELEAALVLFMREVVGMPDQALAGYRQQPMWPGRIKLAPTVPRELSLDRDYRFQPEKFVSLQLPTALLLGKDSPPFAHSVAEKIAGALPNGRIIILPGQGHIAMDINPQLFVDTVLGFLESTP